MSDAGAALPRVPVLDPVVLKGEVKAILTVHQTITGTLSTSIIGQFLDGITDILGLSFQLELIAAEVDPETGGEKRPLKGNAHFHHHSNFKELKYKADFDIPADFGTIGAVLIVNDLHQEVFVKDVVIGGALTISCESFVQSKHKFPGKRVFFASKSYLPSDTPKGLKSLRENELIDLRGNGRGERQDGERIYDYDVYNDLGIPTFGFERPVLGGEEHPYPRRVRTGRPMSKTDPSTETRKDILFYVPRDENFSAIKGANFGATTLYNMLHALVPAIAAVFTDIHAGFPYFTEIDLLYNEGVHVPELKENLLTIIPRLIKAGEDIKNQILKFETPETIDRDKFSWFRDEEFCRQMLAGLNPCCIELVKEWPIMSKLDPEIYGPAESGITTELVEKEIRGFMTVEEAVSQKKLFVLDYHDIFMPYVLKVRELNERTTLYASRTLMFLTPDGTLRPLAIELTRPPGNGKPHWKGVYAPCWDATNHWLWRFAKAHVLAHDSGYHQLISHWLRTHCCTEPYIIATNRQLSQMHPIYRLLHPHLRYTMMINSLARLLLIPAQGIIESTFTPRKYCMEISSVIYKLKWRFDHEAFPADLISRGMAEEDPSAPHGLKLAIEDYPFANDGLVLWDAIKQWVVDYVTYYYTDAESVERDEELQAWWTEIRTVGHADLKDEPWWPSLRNPDDLINILSTITWVTSAHHTAVNFGQYDFAGYFPNRPTICRINMPDEDPVDAEWERFLKRPEDLLMAMFPSKLQATTVMAVLDILSTHSPDEEYIGAMIEPSWEEDPNIKLAHERFNLSLKLLDAVIDERNADPKRKNRNGAGVVPYTLLKPFSEPGMTLKGVPNSISI